VNREAGIRVLVSRGQEGNREEINRTEAKEQMMKATHPKFHKTADVFKVRAGELEF